MLTSEDSSGGTAFGGVSNSAGFSFYRFDLLAGLQLAENDTLGEAGCLFFYEVPIKVVLISSSELSRRQSLVPESKELSGGRSKKR